MDHYNIEPLLNGIFLGLVLALVLVIGLSLYGRKVLKEKASGVFEACAAGLYGMIALTYLARILLLDTSALRGGADIVFFVVLTVLAILFLRSSLAKLSEPEEGGG